MFIGDLGSILPKLETAFNDRVCISNPIPREEYQIAQQTPLFR